MINLILLSNTPNAVPVSKSEIIYKTLNDIKNKGTNYYLLSCKIDTFVISGLIQKISGKYRISPEGLEKLRLEYINMREILREIYAKFLF